MPVDDLLPDDPARLGPYRVLGRLGAGGMGRVYLASAPDGTPVAVKTLHARPEPVARQRMAREVAALDAAAHPGLARLLDHDLAAPVPWLAMTHVPGPALHEVPLPLDGAALDRFATGLARALAALHAAGLVHRDLKPANVILGPDGPVLVDLGIAHHADSTALTQAGTVIGSPGWLAPEQLRGLPVTPAADVWGWAGLVALAATGRPAFGSGDPRGLGWRVLHTDPDLDGVPARWRPSVEAALAKDPAGRPPAALLVLPGMPAGLSPRTEPVPVAVPTQPIPVGPLVALPTARTVTRARRPAGRRLVAAATVLAVCAAAGVAGYRWGDARPPGSRPVPQVVLPSVQAPAADPGVARAQPVTGRTDRSGPGPGRSGSGRGGSGSGRGSGDGSDGSGGGPGPG